MVLLAGLIAGGVVFATRRSSLAPPACRVAGYQLDLQQAANATTITAVGKRLGLADHAVTIGLAAALQESKLHNVDHGDRDSLGLFQQRPSQGWGTPAQILTPPYAAAAFFHRLAQVDGWQTLAVTDAAQQVQHSAAPNAYGAWENEARTLAQALTGEVPAGLACQFRTPHARLATGVLQQTMSEELGTTSLDASSVARGWVVANWLVGHGSQLKLTAVSFGGLRWTPGSGAWVPSSASSGSAVTVAPAVA